MKLKSYEEFVNDPEGALLEIADRLLSESYPTDLYTAPIINRTMAINEAYFKLINSKNYTTAFSYLRLQIDNCLACYAGVLVKEKAVSDYYEECVKLGIDAKQAANWVTVNIVGELNKEDMSIVEFFITPSMLKQIIDGINSGLLSSKQAKEVFAKSIEEKKEPKNYISKENAQISDEGELTNIIVGILDASEEQIAQYKAGKNNLFDYFVGQVMKNTRGKANPVMTKEIIQKELDKR